MLSLQSSKGIGPSGKVSELSVTGEKRTSVFLFILFVHLISLTPKLTRSMLPRRPRETLNNFNELVVRSAIRIAKLADLMFVREPVQAH